MYEAVDLLGFEPTGSGMHQLSYATPNLDNSIAYRDRLENARRTIEKLERLAPNFKELDDLWIFYYVQIGDMASAKKLLEETRSEETSDADIHVMMALFLSSQVGHDRQAEYHFKQAISVEQSNVDHLGMYAIFLHGNQDNQKAIDILHLALDDSPKRPDLINMLGHVLAESGRMEEAETLLRESISLLDQPYAPLYNTLGGILMVTDRHSKAKPFFERAIYYSPKNGMYYYNLSLVLKELGEDDEADIVLKQARQLSRLQQTMEIKLDEPMLETK